LEHCSMLELHLLPADPRAEQSAKSYCERNEIMRRILSIMAVAGALSTFALAESYSGKLLDASCYDKQKQANACDATSSTTAFALDVSGTVYKLDRAGNSKASAAIKNRADRTDPTKQQSKEVMAKVDGTEKGGTIAVENVDVQ
jgi:hypothetical protein